jgi:hypothetical protein
MGELGRADNVEGDKDKIGCHVEDELRLSQLGDIKVSALFSVTRG